MQCIFKHQINLRVYDKKLNDSSKTSIPAKSDRYKRLNKK